VDADGVALWGELFAIQPFGNDVVSFEMTGQQVYDLLNQQFAVNRMLQIAGLSYTWDNSLPAASRVVEVRKDGVAIDRSAVYKVAANSFLVTGGDGFTVFLNGTNKVVGPVDIAALVAFMQTAPQPIAPPALDRVTRLN
jgi:5'-nucleotidase